MTREHQGVESNTAAPTRTASQRGAIAPFYVMEVMRAAEERERAGGDVLHLEVGQPSTPAPSGVIAAAHRALDDDVLGYTTAAGTLALRDRQRTVSAAREARPRSRELTCAITARGGALEKSPGAGGPVRDLRPPGYRDGFIRYLYLFSFIFVFAILFMFIFRYFHTLSIVIFIYFRVRY